MYSSIRSAVTLMAAALPLLASTVLAQEAQGYIHVLDSNKTMDVSNAFGCLSSGGQVTTLDNCGVLTSHGDQLSQYPFYFTTDEGNCTFFDESTPEYDFAGHALTCNSEVEATGFYRIGQSPALCYLNTDCLEDYPTQEPPTAENPFVDIWRFVWSSLDGPVVKPGRTQTVFLWSEL